MICLSNWADEYGKIMSHAMNEPINEHFYLVNKLENVNTNSGWVQFRVAILTAKFLVSGNFVKPLAVKKCAHLITVRYF